MLRNRRTLNLQRLDDRIVPAVAVRLTPTGVLNVTGNPNNDFLTITQVAPNVLNVADGKVSLGTYAAPGGFNALLTRFNQGVLFNTGDFNYTGNVLIDVGNGSTFKGLREVSVFDGSAGGPLGKVSGNVTFRGGNGSEYISVGRPQLLTGTIDFPVQVNGNISVTTRFNSGPDTFELVPGSVAQANIFLNNVDLINIGSYVPGSPNLVTVGGNIVANNPAPSIVFTFDAYATIGGSVTLSSSAGSPASGLVTILDGTTINGNLTAVLPNGVNAVQLGSSVIGEPAPFIGGNVSLVTGTGSDFIALADDPIDGDAAVIAGNLSGNFGQGDNLFFFDSAALVLGSVTLQAGNGNNSVAGLFSTFFAGTVQGNLAITLGNGNNSIDFGGQVFGSKINFTTGGGNDVITIQPSAFAPGATLNVKLGAGDDTFNLNSNFFFVGNIDGGFGFNDDFNSTVVIPITWTITGFEL